MEKQDKIIQVDFAMLPDLADALKMGNHFWLVDNLTGNPPRPRPADGRLMSDNYVIKLSFPIIFFCLEGSMQLSVNLTQIDVGPNDVMVLIPGHIVERWTASADCKAIAMALSGEYASNFMNQRSALVLQNYVYRPRKIHCSDLFCRHFLQVYQMIRDVLQMDGLEYRDELVLQLLGALSYEAAQQVSIEERGRAPEKKTRQEQLYVLFIQQVMEHYREHRDIAFYASQLFLTPKYLARAVYLHTGRHASDIIRDYVILEAKALLQMGSYSVQQVSDQLHFTNASFFGKYFKAAVGCSPRKYQTTRSIKL